MFQLMPALCPHGEGEGEVVSQMWTGLYRGREVPKIPRFVRTSFMDDSQPVPFYEKNLNHPLQLLLLNYYHYNYSLDLHLFALNGLMSLPCGKHFIDLQSNSEDWFFYGAEI